MASLPAWMTRPSTKWTQKVKNEYVISEVPLIRTLKHALWARSNDKLKILTLRPHERACDISFDWKFRRYPSPISSSFTICSQPSIIFRVNNATQFRYPDTQMHTHPPLPHSPSHSHSQTPPSRTPSHLCAYPQHSAWRKHGTPPSRKSNDRIICPKSRGNRPLWKAPTPADYMSPGALIVTFSPYFTCQSDNICPTKAEVKLGQRQNYARGAQHAVCKDYVMNYLAIFALFCDSFVTHWWCPVINQLLVSSL